MTDQAKADLLATIIEESERLNRFIANLLDMTKLESGAIKPNAALHDIGEIVGTALRPREQNPRAALGRGRNSLPIFPCSTSIRSCSSRPCSICWTTPRNIRRQALTVRIQSWQERR